MNEYSFEEADKQIRSIATIEGGRNKRNMTLGWLGARMKAENCWTQHGYADEAAYRDAAGVGQGVWGRYVRIAGCLDKLDLARFVLMSASNAEQLGFLPDELRYQHQWLEDAVKLDAEEFRKRVMRARADAAGVQVKDMRVKFSLPLFETQRAVIKNGIKEFMREHGILDEGTALEWLVLEYSGRKTFSKFIRDQLPLLRNSCYGDGNPKEVVFSHIVALSEMLDNLKGD
jgi:hypothetical protein